MPSVLVRNRHHLWFTRHDYGRYGWSQHLRCASCAIVDANFGTHQAIHGLIGDPALSKAYVVPGLYLPPPPPSEKSMNHFAKTHPANGGCHHGLELVRVSVLQLAAAAHRGATDQLCSTLLINRDMLHRVRVCYQRNPAADVKFWLNRLQVAHDNHRCTCWYSPHTRSIPLANAGARP